MAHSNRRPRLPTVLNAGPADSGGLLSSSRFRAVIFGLLLTPLLAACSVGRISDPGFVLSKRSDTETVTRKALASVAITPGSDGPSVEIGTVLIAPSTVVLDTGEEVALTARALGPDGVELLDVEMVWTLADPRAGTLGQDGLFRAGGIPGVFSGAVAVTAIQTTAEGPRFANGAVLVTVVGEHKVRRLAEVAILVENPGLLAGQIYRLHAVAFDESGLVIPDAAFNWRVNVSSLGRVSDLGYLTVEGPSGSFRDAVTVTVVWEGVSLSKSTGVTVMEVPRADDFLRVQILPTRFHLDPGDVIPLRAIALNGLGEVVRGTQLRWAMSDSSAGSVDGSGLFAAGETSGIFTEAIMVEAVVPGERGFARAVDFASVVIRRPVSVRLDSVRALPGSVVVGPRGRVLLAAQTFSESGERVRGVTFAWRANGDVGAIDQNGSFVSGATPGAYPDALQVTATQEIRKEIITRTASVDVVITGTLTEVRIRPQVGTVPPGRTIHYSASGWDENGVLLSGLVVRWRVSDDEIGSIDALGNFTAGDYPGFYRDVVEAEVIQTLPRLQ